MYMLLHRSDLNISEKFRRKNCWIIFSRNFAKFHMFKAFVIFRTDLNEKNFHNFVKLYSRFFKILEFCTNFAFFQVDFPKLGRNGSLVSPDRPHHPLWVNRRNKYRSGEGAFASGCGKLYRARSRLYRNKMFQVNTRWKALAEIYTMHSFALL